MSIGKLAVGGWVAWMMVGLAILGMAVVDAPRLALALPAFFLWLLVFPVGGTVVLMFVLFGDR